MTLSRCNSSAGFTYIAALVMVVVMGIMLGAVGQSMKIVMKREREKELIFRGLQYRDAIERWNMKGVMPLLELKFLLKDPRSLTGESHLRRLYNDPVTGKEWKVLKDPNLGIYGVASTSEDSPMKMSNFPEVIKDFEGKGKYSEWEFVFKKTASPAAGATPAGATPPGAVPKVLSLPLSTPEGP